MEVETFAKLWPFCLLALVALTLVAISRATARSLKQPEPLPGPTASEFAKRIGRPGIREMLRAERAVQYPQ